MNISQSLLLITILLCPLPGLVSAGELNAAMEAIGSGEYSRGVEMLGPLAQQGDAEAQYLLGRAYAHGQGITADSDIALKWLQMAALQRHYAAANTLGKIYASGLGVKQDTDLAVKWFELAADIAEKSDEEHEDCD